MNEKNISTMADIAQLTPAEFERFLPDLKVWHSMVHQALSLGFMVKGMLWNDDGKPGELTELRIHLQVKKDKPC